VIKRKGREEGRDQQQHHSIIKRDISSYSLGRPGRREKGKKGFEKKGKKGGKKKPADHINSSLSTLPTSRVRLRGEERMSAGKRREEGDHLDFSYSLLLALSSGTRLPKELKGEKKEKEGRGRPGGALHLFLSFLLTRNLLSP